MDIGDAVELVLASSPGDWDRAGLSEDPKAFNGLPGHYYLATFRPQPDLRLAWGRPAEDGAPYPFGYPWIGGHVRDRVAVDAFWQDELGATWPLWLVDNGRCYLPDTVPGMLTAKASDITMARLINAITPQAGWPFDNYMNDSGIIAVDG